MSDVTHRVRCLGGPLDGETLQFAAEPVAQLRWPWPMSEAQNNMRAVAPPFDPLLIPARLLRLRHVRLAPRIALYDLAWLDCGERVYRCVGDT